MKQLTIMGGIEVIESISIPKTAIEDKNEDRIFLSENFIGIIDGATSKDDSLYPEKSSGRLVNELILQSLTSAKPEMHIEMFATHLTKKIRSYYEKHGILEEVKVHPEKRMSASFVVLNVKRREVWMIGDCQCLVDGKTHSNKKIIDQLISVNRQILLKHYLKQYTVEKLLTKDISREDLLPFLKMQYQYQNNGSPSVLGYGVIDGFDINPNHMKVVSVARNQEIIMASDGYPVMRRTLEETELELEKLLEDDPLMFKHHPSTKGLQAGFHSFDDRSYIKILIDRWK